MSSRTDPHPGHGQETFVRDTDANGNPLKLYYSERLLLGEAREARNADLVTVLERLGRLRALPHLPSLSPDQALEIGRITKEAIAEARSDALREVEEALEAAQTLSASPHTAAVLQRLRDRFRAGGERTDG